MSDITTKILLDTAYLVLFIGLSMGLAVGLMALFRPTWAAHLNAVLSRSMTLRKPTRILEKQVHLERHFYRHHRLYGVIMVSLALFILYSLSFRMGPDFASRLAHIDPLASPLVQVMRLLLWLCTVGSLVVGCIMLIRPSALKKFENWSNQWLSTRRGLLRLESEFARGDVLFEKHPRAFGVVVSQISAASLAGLILYWPRP